jgi:hypothetical protein
LDNGMSHGTPLARKGNPTWSFSSAPEPLTPWRNDLLGPAAAAEVFGWLADIPRRIGTRLFLEADEEAYWRGWQVTASRSGLSRTYRDPRFDARGAPPEPDGQVPLGQASPDSGQ